MDEVNQNSQQLVIDSLPGHLRPFVAYQDYTRYTPRDQAVWRFLLHQLRDQLSHSAHPIYQQGLASTGISLDHIPRIEEINAALNKIGWRAVVVDGFVPPAIFMEFQAQQVLAVAVDMRSFEHMLYTPAPDIVHESAGHAPFLIDTDYAEFLQRFGELGMRAVASHADMDVYEAVRHLSIVKEATNSSPSDIEQAEQRLQQAIQDNDNTSEAALIARLHWWTVEYGLVGNTDNYHIFGAGLLSSLGESRNCLNDQRVLKLPLTVDATATPYDITREQPQLYVARNCRHLSQVLEILGEQLCVNRGGVYALDKAIAAATVSTAVTNAGLEISGVFSRVIKDSLGNATYFATSGPSQLAFQGRELPGHGTSQHSAGFGSPVGKLQAMERCLSTYTVDELKQHNIEMGQRVTLEFLSGIKVSGVLRQILRRQQQNLLFSFEDCTVTYNDTSSDGEQLFEPDWGSYDMAVAETIVSLYGGSADQENYPIYRIAPTETSHRPDHSQADNRRFKRYAQLRQIRAQSQQQSKEDVAVLEQFIAQLMSENTNEWLLYFEALELAVQFYLPATTQQKLLGQLQRLADSDNGSADQSRLITCGCQRLGLALPE